MKNKKKLCIFGMVLLVLGILAALAVNTASSQETQSDTNLQEKTALAQQTSDENVDGATDTAPDRNNPDGYLPKVPPPYYKCYKIERQVNLLTQFGLEQGVDVQEKGEFLCAPALLNDTGTRSQQLKNLSILEKNFPHLKFYGIDAPAINVPVSLSSSLFGNETVNVTKPVFLGLPATKAIPPKVPSTQPADPHYKCYEIEPINNVNKVVTLRTQFGNETVRVNESSLLCAPALKNPPGKASQQNKTLEALEKKFPHLKLYTIDAPVIQNFTRNLRTQFGTELNVNITRPLYLAVPVTKEVSIGCDKPPSGMVSWWPGDGNAKDIQNGNDGTLVNGVTFAPGKVASAFSFAGGYVEIKDSRTLDLSLGHTVDLWVKVDAYPPSGEVSILVNKWVSSYEDKLLSINSTGIVSYYLFDTFSRAPLNSNAFLALGTWYHIAATYDGTTANIYVNGVLDAHKAVSSGVSVSNNNGILYFGHNPDRVTIHEPFSPFMGQLDEIEWYNRSLMQPEIRDIYNAGSAGKCH